MELKIFRDALPAAGTNCTLKAELPLETEILISDYLPPVFKLVKCFVRPVVLQKRLQPGKLQLEGYLRCVVYYQGEDGAGLCQTEQKLPFTKLLDLPEFVFTAWAVQVEGQTEYLNCRTVNPRRIEVRGAYGLVVSVHTQVKTDVITALSDGGVEQKLVTLSGVRRAAVLEKLVTVEGEIRFPTPPAAVLDLSGNASVGDLKLLNGKAVAKGVLVVSCAWRAEGDPALQSQSVNLNFNQVLDEMWVVAQEEMNFLTEATNLERFRALNADVAFVTSPMLYREWTTTHVLVMERIDGVAIDDREALLAGGYDPAEIGAKLADNYVRQIMEDGFFHADPHPGNLRVRDGKIVWLDMGMMGTLTERERKLVGQAVSGVARGDVGLCRDAVLGLGEFRGKTDKRQLYRDIEGLLDQYGTADLGSMDLAKVFEDLTDVMKRNGISMPSSLTMLARGLATIEGVVADLSPEINVMNVVTARMGSQLLHSIDWRGEIVRDAQAVYASAHKSLEIPSLMADILRTGLKGEANLGVEHHVGDDMARLMQDVVLKLCAALVAAALLVCGALLRDVAPRAGGLSWLTVFCFLLSAALLGWAFVWKDQKK